jgi:Cu2+-exporting ATPase
MPSTATVTADDLAAPGPALGGVGTVDDPLETERFTRFEPARDGGSRVGVSSLQLSGMHCAACSGIIESALQAVPGVLEAAVNPASQRATVRWDPARTRPSAWIAAVRAAGYGAVPDAAASTRELRRAEHRSAVWRLFVASFCAMQVMMLATPSYVAGPGDLAPDTRALLNWASWVLSLPVMWFSGRPFFQGAWASIRRGRIGMDVPVALGLLVTFVASSIATYDPSGPLGHEVYFDSLTMFLAFLWFGRWLELRARHRAAEELERTMDAMPEAALRVRADGTVEEVSALRLLPGDVVLVPRGSSVPADGRLESGSASVAEALITGESQPVAKRAGDVLLAGSLNVESPLQMRVERVGADTRVQAIVALMREAMSQRPAVARLADAIAGPFLWAVLVLAAGSAAAWSLIDPSRALWVAVSVLIVTCPCALSLATPATLVAAASGLARRGLLLKRVAALEALTRIDRVFVDKTGTLTQDRPSVGAVELRSSVSPVLTSSAALHLAAGLARWSTHPLAQAIVEAAGDGVTAGGTTPWSDVHEETGAGMRARDAAGREWRLGSAAWVGSGAAAVGAALNDGAVDRLGERTGGNAGGVWLGCDGAVVAVFRFIEALRPGAVDAVRALRTAGLRVTLLSGDRAEHAHALAAAAGIDDVIAPATPEHKLQAVRAAQASGQRVAMVGDGLNDAPVLAAADVSFAMGHAALASREGADAVIVSGRLDRIVAARAAAQRALAIVRQNLAWAAAYNLACVPLAMAGWLPPWAAGLGMAASSLLVVLNAQRAGLAPPAADTRN